MVSPDDAKAAAIGLASERHPIFGGDWLDVDAAKTEERELGFILHVQSGRFLETHDASAEIKDVQPIFVHRRTGAAAWVQRYGPSDFVVDGQPGPDWPPLATIVVAFAVVVQAASWVAMWWGLYALALAVGFIPLHFIAFLLAIAFSVLPTDRIIQFARFRSFNRWVGLAVALAGLVLAELLATTFGIMPRLDLELGRPGMSMELPTELVKVVAAAGVGTASTFIGQRSLPRAVAGGLDPRSPHTAQQLCDTTGRDTDAKRGDVVEQAFRDPCPRHPRECRGVGTREPARSAACIRVPGDAVDAVHPDRVDPARAGIAVSVPAGWC